MNSISAEQFSEICNRIWTDREALLKGRGQLSGDATLVRAVYWRLCKAGLEAEGRAESSSPTSAFFEYQLVVGRMLAANARPAFDWAPILKGLIERYQNEAEPLTRK
jgi:phosphopantetheinyl transferase